MTVPAGKAARPPKRRPAGLRSRESRESAQAAQIRGRASGNAYQQFQFYAGLTENISGIRCFSRSEVRGGSPTSSASSGAAPWRWGTLLEMMRF